MMSTFHTKRTFVKEIRSKNSETGYREILKPTCVESYNKHMGGVDIAGQRCKTYKFPHRSRKWYPRLVDYLLSIVFVNSHIIFTSVDGKEKKILKLFIEEVCITFLEGFLRRTAHSQFKEIFLKDYSKTYRTTLA